MKIFLIAGLARHGKDTIGNFIEEYCHKNSIKVCRTQISKYIKMYAKDYFGWDGLEEDKPRELLQHLGTDIIREKMNKPNFFIDRTIEDLEVLERFFNVAIITDIRLPLEINKIKEKFSDVVTIKVERINFTSPLTKEELSHQTETAIDSYNDYDYVVINDTLEQLQKDVIKLIKEEGIDYEEDD